MEVLAPRCVRNQSSKIAINMHSIVLLLLSFPAIISGGLPEGLSVPWPPAAPTNRTLEYMDPTHPPLLPAESPKCSLLVLQQEFADTVGAPPARASYTLPPDCPAPWSRVVLELSASASDVQKDRIAAVWLNGAEILRTTTPFPMYPGVFWRVRKDVTRYTALFRSACSSDGGGSMLSMMLENSNEPFSGVYSVNVSLHFYRGAVHEEVPMPTELKPPMDAPRLDTGPTTHPTIKGGLYTEPADLIIPISNVAGSGNTGFWFQVQNENDVQTCSVTIPRNTYRAVLEFYVSHHGDDEYWYVNPLRQPKQQNAGNDLSSAKANGGFRQVVATIDGRYVGSVVPFPVIYPSSINRFFWAPVSAIGAYNHPSYDIDLTPFVGQLLDGQAHLFGLTVRESQPYWLVSANLHLWLDELSDDVQGALVRYKVPPLRLSRQADWESVDGKSDMDGEVIIRFTGWVSSSRGNVTTSIRHKIKFKSRVEVREKGTVKETEMVNRGRTNIRIERDEMVVGRTLVETHAPLEMLTQSSNGGGGSMLHRTKLHHVLDETRSVAVGKRSPSVNTITDRQVSEGSVLMQDGAVLWGKGDTKSIYKYRDNKNCYLRTVNVVGGLVKEDEETASCAAVAAT